MSRFNNQFEEMGFLRYAQDSIAASCGDMQSFTRPKQGIDRIFNQINEQFERGLIRDKTYFVKRLLSGILAQEGQMPYLHPLLHACWVGNFVAISAILENIKKLNNPEINDFTINLLLDHVFIVRENNIFYVKNQDSSAFGELLKHPERLACFEEFLKGTREIFNDDVRFQNYFKSFFTENYRAAMPHLRTYDSLSVNLNNVLSAFGIGSSRGKLVREADIVRNVEQPATAREQPAQIVEQVEQRQEQEEEQTQEPERVLALALPRQVTSELPGIFEVTDEEARGLETITTAQTNTANTAELVRRERDPMESAEAAAMRESVAALVKAREQADELRRLRAEERRVWQEKLREEEQELERQARLVVALRASSEISPVTNSQNSQDQNISAQSQSNKRNWQLARKDLMPHSDAPTMTRRTPRRGSAALTWVTPVQVPTRPAVFENAKNDEAFKYVTFENALMKFKEKNTYAAIISTPSSAASVASIDLYKELETFAKFVTDQPNHGFVSLDANKFFRPNYDEFSEILKYWNYRLDPGLRGTNLEKLSDENHRLISQLIYFLCNNQAVPLWLMQELEKKRPARTEETFKTILGRIPSRASRLIASQLPENPSLQDLINGGATLDEIKKYVEKNTTEVEKNTKKNDESELIITSLKGVVTHPEYKEILDFLTQNRADKKPLLSYETDAKVINEALTQANEIGAFNFFAYKQEWCSKWAQTKEIQKALKALYSPDVELKLAEENFLVNLLKASQKIKFALKPISSVAKSHDADDSAAVRAIATYLTSSLLTSQNSPSSEEIAYLLDRVSKLADANAREEILLRTIKNVALASGAVLASLIEGLQAKKFMTKKITASLFESPYQDHTTLKSIAMSLTENALHELAHKKDAVNFMKLMKFVKSAGPSHVSYVLKFRHNQKKGLAQSISEKIPEIFPEFYDLYIKNLDKDGKEEIYNQGEDLNLPADLSQRVNCNHNFVFEGVKASLGDVAFLRNFLLDVQDNLDPITFYLRLTAVRVGETKNAQEIILEHFKYDTKTRAEFEDYFSDIEEEMMIFRDGKKALDDFSARFLPTFSKEMRRGDHLQDIIDRVPGQNAKKYAENYYRNKTNVVSRFVHYLNNINEFDYPTPEIKGFKPDILEEIIYRLLAFDSADSYSFATLQKTGFREAKKKGELSKENELATKLVTYAFLDSGTLVPLWLQQEIIDFAKAKSNAKDSDKNYLQKGIALITASIKNPQIRAILEKKRSDISPASLATLTKKPNLAQLLIAGANLSDFQKYFKENPRKPIGDLDMEFLLAHPDAITIKDLIAKNIREDHKEEETSIKFEASVFRHAIAIGCSDFLEKSSAKIISMVKNCVYLDLHLQNALDFEQQRAILPLYTTLIKTPRLAKIPFCQTPNLFSHLIDAAQFYPNPSEFFEYLSRVEIFTSVPSVKGEESPFKKLLKYAKEDNLVKLVRENFGESALSRLETFYIKHELQEEFAKHNENTQVSGLAQASAQQVVNTAIKTNIASTQ